MPIRLTDSGHENYALASKRSLSTGSHKRTSQYLPGNRPQRSKPSKCASQRPLSENRLSQAREVTLRAFIGRSAHPEPGFDVNHAAQSSDRNKAFFVPPTKVSFGAFRLLPTQFLLLKGEKPVPHRSRALEILTILLERRAELVSKEDLMG